MVVMPILDVMGCCCPAGSQLMGSCHVGFGVLRMPAYSIKVWGYRD